MSTLTSYITGFVLSILFTVAVFSLQPLHQLFHHTFLTHQTIWVLYVVFALLQLLVQLFFFLHLSSKKNHWNVAVLGFALFIIALVVGGTLWIMSNVQHNMKQGSPYINNEIKAQNSND
jgi:cytochrome o ubiquinol oxidase operon protein cyoD